VSDLEDIRALKRLRVDLAKRIVRLDTAISKFERKLERERQRKRERKPVGRPSLEYDYSRAVREGVQAKRDANPQLSLTDARRAYARDCRLSFKYIEELHLWTADKMRRMVDEFLDPGKDNPDLHMDLHVSQWRWEKHVEQIQQRPHRPNPQY
jgi:hypothetical protein